jgi:hypothetical protein
MQIMRNPPFLIFCLYIALNVFTLVPYEPNILPPPNSPNAKKDTMLDQCEMI